jgi:invasion protein IalB
MKDLLKTASLAALAATFALSAPALAQEGGAAPAETAQPAPAETPAPAAPAEAAPAAPQAQGQQAQGQQEARTVVAGTYGDWQMVCAQDDQGQQGPCRLAQLLKDENGNATAEIMIYGLPAGQEAAAGVSVATPPETLLQVPLSLSVDGGKARTYPYHHCLGGNCVSLFGFTEAEVNEFKRGAKATITIVPLAAPDQTVPLTVSLSGFTAGYEAVNQANGTPH